MNQEVDTAGDGTNNFSLTGTGAEQTIKVYGDLAVKDSASAGNGVYTASYTLTADYK